MAFQGNRTEPRRPVPRLYLVAPQAADPAGLAGALGAADIAAVLLRLPAHDDRGLINHVKALAPIVQDKGAALVLDGHPDIVARAGADGAQLAGIAAFTVALAALKPDRIAGCASLESRDDAMRAAEAGADYVMFGEPDEAGHRPSFEAIIERISWWAEVFEIPCVGYAGTLAEVDALAAAGADFVAVGDCIFTDARGPAAAIGDAASRLAASEPVE
jgi:thiamine-phosphate pyrophosphorylase